MEIRINKCSIELTVKRNKIQVLPQTYYFIKENFKVLKEKKGNIKGLFFVETLLLGIYSIIHNIYYAKLIFSYI